MRNCSLVLLAAIVALSATNPNVAHAKLRATVDTASEEKVDYVFLPMTWLGSMTNFPSIVYDAGRSVRFVVEAKSDKSVDLGKHLQARQRNGLVELLVSPALAKACKSTQTAGTSLGIDKRGTTESGVQWSFRMGIFSEPSEPIKSGICPSSITVVIPKSMQKAKVMMGENTGELYLTQHDQGARDSYDILVRKAQSEDELLQLVTAFIKAQKKLVRDGVIALDRSVLDWTLPALPSPEKRLALYRFLANDIRYQVPANLRRNIAGDISRKYFDGQFESEIEAALRKK